MLVQGSQRKRQHGYGMDNGYGQKVSVPHPPKKRDNFIIRYKPLVIGISLFRLNP